MPGDKPYRSRQYTDHRQPGFHFYKEPKSSVVLGTSTFKTSSFISYVNVGHHNTRILKFMHEWCKNNCRGNHWFSNVEHSYFLHAYFENNLDAIMFMTTWYPEEVRRHA